MNPEKNLAQYQEFSLNIEGMQKKWQHSIIYIFEILRT